MAHPNTEKLFKEILQKLADHGVNNYVVALSDPDSNFDCIRSGGSVFWRMGVGLDLLEEGKATRRKEWEKEMEGSE